MREIYSKFENWVMVSLILLTVMYPIVFNNLSIEEYIFSSSKAGFTFGLAMLFLLGPLCLLVSRFESTVALWLLVVFSLPLAGVIPILILWFVLPLGLTAVFFALIAAYFRGFAFLISDPQVRAKLVK